jgi:predicted Zn-dependent protease
MARRVFSGRGPLALLVLCSLLLNVSCSVNPATGKQQLSFYDEAEEIEMGREADAEIVASAGLYDDPGLQEYVEELGQRLAAESERPHLPWSFKVLDDPAVNAFALPGGYVYVTRGLLTHMESEAELAGVIGHEIGHVTARHSVNQASKQMLAMVGLGLAALLSPEMEDWAGAASVGAAFLFLKYGRDDERQADDLGLRYMSRSGYDPREMPGVFAVLDGVQQEEGGGGMPAWLSTHPDPGRRQERMAEAVAALDGDFESAMVHRDEYLRRLDGIVFGGNPRDGFFEGNAFVHPDLRFRFEFPEGWEASNEPGSVSASSPAEDAYLQITLADHPSAEAAADAFFEEEGLTRGDSWEKKIHGLPAAWTRFEYLDSAEAEDAASALSGTVVFVEYGEQLFQLLALSGPDEGKKQRRLLEDALASFSRLDDPKALGVQPHRLRLVKISREMTLEEFDRKYPSSIEMPLLALINHVQSGETLRAGTLVKRVVEGDR